MAGTAARDNETRIDYSANEGNSAFDGLAVLLFGVESEAEFAVEVFGDDAEVA